MNNSEFEQFVLSCGKDVLKFCRISTGNNDLGDELYQDTMVKLLEKRRHLDSANNVKSYALQVAVMLLKNKRKKYAVHQRIAPLVYPEDVSATINNITDDHEHSPEQIALHNELVTLVRNMVANLSEELRIPILLYYSADVKISEIASILNIPEGTVKTRIHRAKNILKDRLEESGYDG